MELDPVPTLLSRLRAELAMAFDPIRPLRISRAPGRLDVMGGISDYTGGLVCEMPLAAGTAVAMQDRQDRQLSVFSFNLLDEHLPFQWGMSLDALAAASADGLGRELSGAGRQWAGYVAGCLYLLHAKRWVDLTDPRRRGLNIAVLSSLPVGGGVSSSAALEVATMLGLLSHFEIPLDVREGAMLEIAALCQEVENRVVGAPCGIMDQVTCLLGTEGSLLLLQCQPHTLLPPLQLPKGVRVTGLFTGVRHKVAGVAYARTRAAAFMGHAMILEHMRHLGRRAGRELICDPTNGYLANLDPADYKALFRPLLPESISGEAFLKQHGTHGDTATQVDPAECYPIQAACDHHVLEARRVRRFAAFLEDAHRTADGPAREKMLRSGGRLMYASHRSYTEKASLGHDAAELLVRLVRQRERSGLYGARITGGGAGGTVAVLSRDTPEAAGALAESVGAFTAETGVTPAVLEGSSDGAAYAQPGVMGLVPKPSI